MFSAFTLLLAWTPLAAAGDDDFYKKAVLEQICFTDYAAKVSDNKALQTSFCGCFVEELSVVDSPEILDTPEGQAMFIEADRVCRPKPVTPSAGAEPPGASITDAEKRLMRESCLRAQAGRPDIEQFCDCKTERLIARTAPGQRNAALDPALVVEAHAFCVSAAAPPAASAPQEPR